MSVSPMHVVYTFADLRVGGAEVNAVHLAQILARRGHHVTVIAGEGPLAASLRGERIDHVARAMQLKRPWTILHAATALLAVHRDRPIDVVHAFMASGSASAALASRRLGRRLPIIAAPPGFRDRNEPAFLSRLRLRVLTAGADLVLAPSRAFLEESRHVGVAEDRLRLVPFNATLVERFADGPPPGADYLAELGLAPGDRVVCSLARLHPTKGQDLLLRAAPHVLASAKDARFLLVGDGPWRSHLSDLAESLGVAHAVRFAGQRSDVPRILSIADLLVQTTFGYGGPGLSVIEAFAAGVPVVGMTFPDLAEAVGDSGGAILVPHGDVPALAQAIVSILTDRDLAGRMAGRARAHSSAHFDMSRVATTLEKIYWEVAHPVDEAS